MTADAACSECGATDQLEMLGELAPGAPWFVCRRCLLRQSADALAAERVRQGADPALVAEVRERALRRSGVR